MTDHDYLVDLAERLKDYGGDANRISAIADRLQRLEEELQGWHEMVTVPTEKR